MFQYLRTLLAGNQSSVPGVSGAVAQFQRFEKDLQQDFFALAAQSGKPRDLRWVSGEWLDELLIVVDEESQLIIAFASINIGFEAVEGGEMVDVEAVSTIRDGTAVFHFQDEGWGSAGRVVFNMSPAKAAVHMIPDADTVFHRKPPQELAPRVLRPNG